MKLNPPKKISRTPRSKSESKTVESPTSIAKPSTENTASPKKQAAIQNVIDYKLADKRLLEIAASLSEEEFAALAEHKGLKLKDDIPFTRHTFQIREDHLKMFQEYTSILGKKKKHAFSEAMSDFFEKHKEAFERVSIAKSNK